MSWARIWLTSLSDTEAAEVSVHWILDSVRHRFQASLYYVSQARDFGAIDHGAPQVLEVNQHIVANLIYPAIRNVRNSNFKSTLSLPLLAEKITPMAVQKCEFSTGREVPNSVEKWRRHSAILCLRPLKVDWDLESHIARDALTYILYHNGRLSIPKFSAYINQDRINNATIADIYYFIVIHCHGFEVISLVILLVRRLMWREPTLRNANDKINLMVVYLDRHYLKSWDRGCYSGIQDLFKPQAGTPGDAFGNTLV